MLSEVTHQGVKSTCSIPFSCNGKKFLLVSRNKYKNIAAQSARQYSQSSTVTPLDSHSYPMDMATEIQYRRNTENPPPQPPQPKKKKKQFASF